MHLVPVIIFALLFFAPALIFCLMLTRALLLPQTQMTDGYDDPSGLPRWFQVGFGLIAIWGSLAVSFSYPEGLVIFWAAVAAPYFFVEGRARRARDAEHAREYWRKRAIRTEAQPE